MAVRIVKISIIRYKGIRSGDCNKQSEDHKYVRIGLGMVVSIVKAPTFYDIGRSRQT